MNILKNVFLSLCLGLTVNSFSFYIKSNFLPSFLHAQIVPICITLIAITSAIRGIILGKLIDVGKLYKEINLQRTFKELRISIYEQVSMIAIAIILLILYGSEQIPDKSLCTIQFLIDSILTSILFFNIYILCDTGFAIIDIFSAIDIKNKQDE